MKREYLEACQSSVSLCIWVPALYYDQERDVDIDLEKAKIQVNIRRPKTFMRNI